MKTLIETFTGRQINPFAPQSEAICIEDIAHSLAFQCRFNGHCKAFYSVAEHSVHCANFAANISKNSLIPFFTLLHDASEAYLCDIPRPLKAEFPNYLSWEKQLSDMIFAKFATRIPNDEEKAWILRADNTMLATEAALLTSSKGEIWELPDKPLADFKLPCWKPVQAEKKFLESFSQYG